MSDDLGALLARGEALIQLGRHDAAVAELARAVALDPSDGAQAHCLMAQAFLGLGRPAEALAAAERAASSTPEWAWPHRLRAIALLRLGRNRDALVAAEESARLTPYEPAALSILSQARRARRDLPGAERAAREAVRVAPHSVLSHNALALWAIAARRPAEAEAACRRSLAIDPHDSDAMNNLGVAQLRQFHVLRALRTYSAAVQLDPTDDLPQDNLHGFFRTVFIVLGVFAFVALVNVGDWIKGFSHLSSGGRLGVAVAVAVGLAGAWRFGPVLARRLPGPAVAIARDVVSFRRFRRSRRLTRRGVWSTWIWLAVAAMFLLGAVSLVFDPVEADDRSSGLVVGPFALAVGALAAWRLIRHHLSR